MDDNQFQEAVQKQHLIKEQALRLTPWRTARSIHDKAARFPPFKQGPTLLKTGTQAKPGHMRLPVDIIMHESVPMKLSDGVTLYSDVLLPGRFQDISVAAEKRVPALVAWSPYGKQMGTTLLDDLPMRAGVPKEWATGLQKWEGPDPGFWCAHEYAVVNVDTRGEYSSEGDLRFFGYQEAQDGAEFVTWVSQQPWCNGKVALTGNSWLAILQWKIGSLRPEGLAALAPWEGQGRLEDATASIKGNDLWIEYWEDKKRHPEWITAPTYVVSSWTNPVHTPGTFDAWSQLPDSTPKWLRVHNKQEWSDYYDDNSTQDLKRFFDYYLHGRIDNGWETIPRVRLSILHFGLTSIADTVNRPEADFPLSRTRHVHHYLTSSGGLTQTVSQAKQTEVSYASETGNTTFRYTIPSDCETTGYFKARLVMISESPEMDVFVQVEKLTPDNRRQGTLAIKPQSAIAQTVIKFLHNRQIGLSKVGLLFHWGPFGQFRASHAATYCPNRSTPSQPFYNHDTKKAS